MKITKHTVPSMTYTLKVEGQVVDQTDETQPLTYLAGVGMMIPGFEAQLEGKVKGDEFDFQVGSDDGFGQIDPNAVVEIPMNVFEVEGKVDTEVVKVGAMLPMQDQNGNPMHGVILEMKETAVKMDFNHVLAGKDLHFTGKILDVREASAEELEHGHVHGPGGHEH